MKKLIKHNYLKSTWMNVCLDPRFVIGLGDSPASVILDGEDKFL